jgi:hypothetical protein
MASSMPFQLSQYYRDAKGSFTEDQITYFKKLKDMNLKNPFLIGFGISKP